MAHLDIEFPRDIAAGCRAMLARRDEVVILASGHEETNQRWAHARRSYAAGLGIRSADDLAKVIALFEEVRGRANSFRLRDWSDWRSPALAASTISATDQPLGTGTGSQTAFQIVKRYGTVNPYLRPIALPAAASVKVAVNGTPLLTGWSLSAVGGIVTFDVAPASGAVLTAGFSFDVPVRFENDTLAVEWAYFTEGRGSGLAPDVPLIEVRLDTAP